MYAPNMSTAEIVEQIWQGKKSPVPEASIIIAKEAYQLTFIRDLGKFVYQTSSGKSLKQDDL